MLTKLAPSTVVGRAFSFQPVTSAREPGLYRNFSGEVAALAYQVVLLTQFEDRELAFDIFR